MLPARLLALCWTLGILVACSIPGKDLPAINIVSFDKFAHFAVFMGFGWLWMRAIRGAPARRARYVLGAGFAYAVLTEIYQGLLPFERTPDPMDALANTIGLLVGVVAYYGLRAKKQTIDAP